MSKNVRSIFIKSLFVTGLLAAVVASVVIFADTKGKKGNAEKTEQSLVEHLTIESFTEKICDCASGTPEKAVWSYKGTTPAVIDFYADWCAPCKILSPVLEKLSVEYKGKVKIYKVNTDEQRQLSALFGISSVPSVLFIPANGTPQMAMGAMPKEEIERIFAEFLGVKK